MTEPDFYFDAEINRHVLVRHFPDREPASVVPNPRIPIYIGPSLLGQRVELELRSSAICGVCVAIHRDNGVVVLAPARTRREDGTWATTNGKRIPYVREEILTLTVDGDAR